MAKPVVSEVSAVTETTVTVTLESAPTEDITDAAKFDVELDGEAYPATAVVKDGTDLTGKTYVLTVDSLKDKKGTLSVNGVEKSFDLSLPVLDSATASNATTVQVTLPTDSKLTEESLVGKTISVTAGENYFNSYLCCEKLSKR